MPPEKKLVLIDGHALAYRAFHALPGDMKTSQGELTNAVYGFTSMLLNVLQEEQPTHIAVTFDKGLTFRHDVYADYKAHRAKMPEDMRSQMERIRQVVETLDIPVFEQEGYEADDLLGTLARQAEEQGVDTLIVTGDMDLLQLVDEHTHVLTSRWRFSDTVVYDLEGVQRRYGLPPAQLIEFKALVGDKSDNIPGVPGVGEKTAVRLLQQYGSLEGVYEHLDEVQARFRNKLEAGRDLAFLSRRLATIVRDSPVQLDLDACRVRAFDRERVMDLFRQLEFHSLAQRLSELEQLQPAGAPAATAAPHQLSLFGEGPSAALEDAARRLAATTGKPGGTPGADYQIVASEEALRQLVEQLQRAPALTLDTETTHTDPMQADLVGIALTDAPERGYYVPVAAPSGDPQLPVSMVLDALAPLLGDPKQPKYGHNLKYDLAVLIRAGAQLEGLAFDTMVAEWLVNPASKNLGLKNLAWARLKQQMTPITDLIGKGKDQVTMDQVPVALAAPYACADVDMTHRLVTILAAELEEKHLRALFDEVEMPLIPALAAMEMAGVWLDVEQLARMSDDLAKRLGELEARIQEMVGYAFNVNSTQQLSDALFQTLGLPTQGLRRTKSGHFSTAAGVLERMRGKHPVIDLILEQRALAKLKSTYVDALPRLVNPRTGRLHTSYNQTGTVTGRISSSDPNLQNIPIRTELGRQVRRAFVAEPGWQLVAADYSQVELRVMAHISGDEGLLGAFARGEDIHASTAAAILGVPLGEVTPDMRRLAKAVNFGLSYGQTAYGLAQATGLTQAEAENFIKAYFERFPKVREYIDRTKALATRQGYVETLLGRRRYFPELLPGSQATHNVRQAAERMAINAPIQGTAADIINIATIHLHRALQERGLRARMILQVHDELVVEAPDEEVTTVAPLVREIMEDAFDLKAPLKADLKVGQNWEEM
ncbi:MAG TPA: DNA polymerase I [Anaerolineae bacterium]|nr:DNA polymerase I [Anaerolineae bacterium]